MKGYKVFKWNNKGEILSCVVQGKARVNYRKGKKSKAPAWLRKINCHLTFFEFLIDAVIFKTPLLQNTQVWKVRVQKKRLISPKLNIENLGKGIVNRDDGTWPRGTSMAEIVIPVEKVDRNTLRRERRKLW